jgi:peptide/nickel transport system substrate-binding protein
MHRRSVNLLSLVLVVILSLSLIPSLTNVRMHAEAQQAVGAITCPKTGGTFVVIHWGDPKSFNPDSQVDDALYIVASNIFNKLVTLDINFNVIPDLAESWEVAPNGSTFVFHLRKNVRWHDGYPFTAKDVKYTFEAIKKYKGIAYTNLKMDDLIAIETPDNYTVIFRYSKPFPAFLGFLAWYGTFILPEHIYNKSEYKDWMDPQIPALTKPVGTGPFKFVEYVKGDHITLEANPDYFKGRPCIDRLVFKIVPDPTAALQSFLAGEGDLLNNRPPMTEIPKLNSTPGIIVLGMPWPSRWYIAFNLLNPILADVRMRYAIAYAINRSELVVKAENGYGYPAEGTYTPAIKWAYNPNAKLPPYDPDKANQLLDELGYKKGPDGYRYLPNGTKLTLRITIFTGSETEAIATVIKEQLKKVGIDAKIEEFEIAAWEDKVVKKRDFDIALLDGFQGPDPDNMRMRFGPGAYINMANYSNPEFGKLLEQAASEPDMEKRRELYWKAQEIMARDLPYLPLVDLMVFFIYRTEWHGFYWEQPGVVGTNSFERVWWEKGTPAQVTSSTKPTTTQTSVAISTPSATTSPTTLTVATQVVSTSPQQGVSTVVIAVAVAIAIVVIAVAVIVLRRR